ncbi:hypothetical protein BKA66DRAFT_451746 [Pyrenochaeta sp. MPI-SDFR-AT-0127]|nr:hypothetical protein BKA66DRAFT_451746 [Pyrenochaeta sp. MPI-SDFR-AT-0127]
MARLGCLNFWADAMLSKMCAWIACLPLASQQRHVPKSSDMSRVWGGAEFWGKRRPKAIKQMSLHRAEQDTRCMRRIALGLGLVRQPLRLLTGGLTVA